MTTTTKVHGLTPEMAALLVAHNQRSSDLLAPLMREFALHRDLESMTSLSDAIRSIQPDTLSRQALFEVVFAPVGWGSTGSEVERNFEAQWISKWQPKPKVALEALVSMAAEVKKGQGKQDIDVNRMVALIEMARPLITNDHSGLASVFSPFVSQMFEFVDRRSEKRDQAALDVIEKVFSLDPQTMFRPESSTPEFDLSKRPKNAHPDSAEGLSFRVTSHNLISFVNAQRIPHQSKWKILDFLERFYPIGLRQAEGDDFVRSEALNMSIGPGIEMNLLQRGWLDKDAATHLFQSSVSDHIVKPDGKFEQSRSVYAVALASRSLQNVENAIDMLKAFGNAGVDLDQNLVLPKGSLLFHGTLLHFASMEGTPDFVAELLRNCSDPTKRMTTSLAETGASRGKDGFTAAQLAAFEMEKCRNDPNNEPKLCRLESIVSILRSHSARAVAHQMLEDMDAPSPSAGAEDHAASARL